MKTLPVYENLDTSFVNLSALMRHLRAREIAGLIQIRLNGYTGEITFAAENTVKVEEHDQIAGRIAEGDEALQRLLIRAREPGGVINVYQYIKESEILEQKIEVEQKAASEIGKPIEKPHFEIDRPRVEKQFAPAATAANGNGAKEKVPDIAGSNDFLNLLPKNHSPLPFEFTNRVEDRARQAQMSPGDWETLLRLVGELLGSVEEVFTNANLSFGGILSKARAEISDDYPFLDPASGVFYYADGKAEMNEKVNAKLFAASINESLRRVLERLADNPNLAEVYRDATHKILSLVHRHKPLYDKFFITPQLEKIIGV